MTVIDKQIKIAPEIVTEFIFEGKQATFEGEPGFQFEANTLIGRRDDDLLHQLVLRRIEDGALYLYEYSVYEHEDYTFRLYSDVVFRLAEHKEKIVKYYQVV